MSSASGSNKILQEPFKKKKKIEQRLAAMEKRNIDSDSSETTESESSTDSDDSEECYMVRGTRPPVLGIDLGTTTSSVAVFRNDAAIIFADHETKNCSIPSYVAFTDKECLIGEAAKAQADTNAANTIYDAKRLMGLSYDNQIVQNDLQFGLWPFKVINSKNRPRFEVTFKGETRILSPIEIGGLILKKLKDIAKTSLGLGEEITDAVITVPANFSNSQREATRDAGRMAGLNVIRILNEPTAAAIALQVDRTEKNDLTVCVYDLGGGTFDVTVITFAKTGAVRCRATAGNPHLGGEDFDDNMVQHVLGAMSKIPIFEGKTISGADKRHIRTACVKAKHELSFKLEATIFIEKLLGNINFTLKVTRDEFEAMNADKFQQTIDMVLKAIGDAKDDNQKPIHVTDIKKFVLVGGSTRIPKITKLLRENFGHADIVISENPDTIVAHGAAIQGAILKGDEAKSLDGIHLLDVTPLPLGIGTMNNYMDVVIRRNTRVPCSITHRLSTGKDNQRKVMLHVYEGESSNVLENNLLGTLKLKNLPDGSSRLKRINVIFAIDENGIMNVTATVTGTDIKKELAVEHNIGRLSDAELKRMVKSAIDYYCIILVADEKFESDTEKN